MSAVRRPYQSAGQPAVNAPTIVPISALATVNPSHPADSPNTLLSQSVVPEMTAVSNPNSKPPNAATTVAQSNRSVIYVSQPPYYGSVLPGRSRGLLWAGCYR